jgi:hypothetical protein
MTNENTTTPEAVAAATPAAEAKPKAAKKAAAKPKAKKAAVKKAATKASKKSARKQKAQDGEVPKGPAALRAYAPSYVKDKEHKTPAGHTSVHCGDEVAKKLLGKDLDACYAIAAKTIGEDEKELRKLYKHLNVGMQRMNLGNKMRGVLNAK